MRHLFEKVKTFFQNPSYPRTIALIGILTVALAIPVTVTVLNQTTHFANFAYLAPSTHVTPAPTTCKYRIVLTKTGLPYSCSGTFSVTTYQKTDCSYQYYQAYVKGQCGYVAPKPTPTPVKPYVNSHNQQTCGPSNNGICVYHTQDLGFGNSNYCATGTTSDRSSACTPPSPNNLHSYTAINCGTGKTEYKYTSNTYPQNPCATNNFSGGNFNNGNYYKCCIPQPSPTAPATHVTPAPTKAPICPAKNPVCTSPSSCKLAKGTQGTYCGGGITTPEYWCKLPTTGCVAVTPTKTTSQTGSGSTGSISGSTGSTGNTGGTSGTGGSTPAPACTNGKTTHLAIKLKLDGIGTADFENHAPAHTKRAALSGHVVSQKGRTAYTYSSTTGQFTYTNGTFNSSTVTLGSTLTCGNTYAVTIKIPRYLPVTGTVKYGTNNTLTLSPIAGDINRVNPSTKTIDGDGIIDINDYNIVRACRNVNPTTPQSFTSGSTTVSATCGDLMNFLDYPDGGTQGDEWAYNYNVWVRGYVKANGY